MTIKEITALRKAGRLEEALQAAEQEFSLNANNFTASALFWCYSEQAKNETEPDSLQSLFEKMKSLHENYAPADEFMPRFLQAVEAKLDPLGRQIREATEAAKSGRNDMSRLNAIQEAFDRGALSPALHRDYGWLIFYSLKNAPLTDHVFRKRFLHQYLCLGLPAPELLHSLILGEAVKVEKNTPYQFRMRDFMRLWDWKNIREEDWEQYKSDNGHTVTSLVEKLIGVFAKEVKDDRILPPAEFESLLDEALTRFPNSQFMPFYKATVLKAKGENEEALTLYKQLLLKTPSRGYLWKQAAELVEDPELRIALLCKAVEVEHDESFKGSSRLALAKALIARGMPANAKQELDIYRNFYLSQGWHLKNDFIDVDRTIPPTIVAADNKQLYAHYLPMAEEFIYSAVPSELAVKVADKQVDDRNRPGRKLTQWTLRTKEGTLFLKKPAKFGLDNRTPNGSVYDVRQRDGRIVWIKKSSQNPLEQEWIKKVEGTLRLRTDRNGNPYALLDGVYIGRRLLSGIADGQTITAIALRQDDGRWSAIALKSR